MSNDPRDYQITCDMCDERHWISEGHDCPAVHCANTDCNSPFIPSKNEITCNQCGSVTEDEVVQNYLNWFMNSCENPFEEFKHIYDRLTQEDRDQWLDTYLAHTSDE